MNSMHTTETNQLLLEQLTTHPYADEEATTAAEWWPDAPTDPEFIEWLAGFRAQHLVYAEINRRAVEDRHQLLDETLTAVEQNWTDLTPGMRHHVALLVGFDDTPHVGPKPSTKRDLHGDFETQVRARQEVHDRTDRARAWWATVDSPRLLLDAIRAGWQAMPTYRTLLVWAVAFDAPRDDTEHLDRVMRPARDCSPVLMRRWREMMAAVHAEAAS